MEVKTFQVRDVRTGLRTIKRELGDDAVILETRRRHDEGGRQYIELTVAVEPTEAEADAASAPPAGASRREPAPTGGAEASAEVASGQLEALRALIGDLSAEVRGLRQELGARPEPRAPAPERAARPDHEVLRQIGQARRGSTREAGLGRAIGALCQELCDAGILPEQVDDLLGRALAQGAQAPDQLREVLEERMARDVRVGEPLWHSRASGREIVLFVGATGVGKTTSVAKAAALARIVGRKRVGLIAADAFRIGAIYQLERYAELLDVPLKVASTAQEYGGALRELGDRDLILVDTTGHHPWSAPEERGPRGELELAELLALHSMEDAVRLELCVSATTSTLDAIALARTYQDVPGAHLCLTKLDEARRLGLLYALPAATGLPVSHLCDGPIVPEHIRETTTLELIHLATRGERPTPEAIEPPGQAEPEPTDEPAAPDEPAALYELETDEYELEFIEPEPAPREPEPEPEWRPLALEPAQAQPEPARERQRPRGRHWRRQARGARPILIQEGEPARRSSRSAPTPEDRDGLRDR